MLISFERIVKICDVIDFLKNIVAVKHFTGQINFYKKVNLNIFKIFKFFLIFIFLYNQISSDYFQIYRIVSTDG
jgi:hypothetical protein